MRLILFDNDGTLLDSTHVSPDQWARAMAQPEIARLLLAELESGDAALVREASVDAG